MTTATSVGVTGERADELRGAPEMAPLLEDAALLVCECRTFAANFSSGITVFPRLVASHHRVQYQQSLIRSNVPSLDDLMGGGLDRGTSTLLIGPPGCGKSTLAIQYASAAASRGDHAAIFMFDETRAALLMRCKGIGMSIKEGKGPGEMRLRQIDPAEVSPGEFVTLVRETVEHGRARVVVIDSLNGYLNSMPHDDYLKAQLHELLSYLNNTRASGATAAGDPPRRGSHCGFSGQASDRL
jgi:KaiC